MLQKRSSIIAASATVMAAWSSSISSAAIVYNTNVSPTKSNGDFISGTGIQSNGFAIETDATTGVSVALEARSRANGQESVGMMALGGVPLLMRRRRPNRRTM